MFGVLLLGGCSSHSSRPQLPTITDANGKTITPCTLGQSYTELPDCSQK